MLIANRDVVSVISLASRFAGKVPDSTSSLERRLEGAEVIPSPIVVPPSGYFEGVDGLWSTFNIRVGTPSQSVRVLASTNSPDTLVVVPGGCTSNAIPEGVPDNCVFSRGGTFNNTLSTTWEEQGYYGINGGSYGFEANLEYSVYADYGLETLGLGFVDGVDAPTLTNQTVAALALPSPFYLGIFGLGTQPQIYKTFGNYSVPSFFQQLRNNNLIPSLSWSYTAGANYKLSTGQSAQLIFGGYDTSRFQSNNVLFTINADVTRDLVVGIQSIFYTGTTTISLLSTPIYSFIESTDPNIWLPLSACLLFEQAFGLTFDNATELYLMNTTQYTALSALNPSVTFRLANTISGGSTVDILLPFSAFALKAAYPFVPKSNSTYYFPLKRATNETQYTLGRSFLQEAYLTVDYERGNFSVSQCTWVQQATPNIISIRSPSYPNSGSSSNSTQPSSDPSTGKKGAVKNGVIGAVVAVAVVAIVAGTGIFLYCKKKSKLREKEEVKAADTIALTNMSTKDEKSFDPMSDAVSTMPPTYERATSIHSNHFTDGELIADGRVIYQLSAETRAAEVADTDAGTRFELESPLPVEIDGESGIGRDPFNPKFGIGSVKMPSPLGKNDETKSPASETSTSKDVSESWG